MKNSSKTRLIVLFDGICNFCNSSVNLIIDHDKAKHIKFASLQSPAGQKLLDELGLATQDISTIVFIEGDNYFLRSTAILRISEYLSGMWGLGYWFLIIPAFIRDAIYRVIAKNRYNWFGKREQCRIPGPEDEERFIEEG